MVADQMTAYPVRVTQVYRAERTIVIDVLVEHGEGVESAIEQVQSGSIDVPEFDNPEWTTGWDLQNEEVTSA